MGDTGLSCSRIAPFFLASAPSSASRGSVAFRIAFLYRCVDVISRVQHPVLFRKRFKPGRAPAFR
jgi:hypothetical protein